MRSENSGIYKIINRANSKFYIGSSINLSKRKLRHFSELKTNKHPNSLLQRAYNKYGKESFEFIIIELTEKSKEKLIEREQYYLDVEKPFDREVGYNMCKTAWTCLGIKRSDEWKAKMSKAHKGKILTPEQRRRMSEGHLRNMTDETRKRISEGKKGHKMHPNTRLRLTEAVLGNKWMIGKKLSEETKRKISEGNKNKIQIVRKCPNCNKIGKGSTMFRFHFDRCKQRAA